jgi:glycosyltransferase involved in cell wall biosynthesis
MESCRAFCLPGREDFGITPVEANAAGKPVIAFRGGGALETIEDGRTGVFFTERSVEAVLDAVARADRLTTSHDEIAASAARFAPAAFRDRLLATLGEAR